MNRITLATTGVALLALTGCSQVTVTSNTLVNGASRLTDATTNAVRSTSDFTTDTTNRADAQTYAARLAYVRSEMPQLRREAAAGSGEHLDALAYMMRRKDTQAFARQLQSHYRVIFAADEKPDDAAAVLDRLQRVAGKSAPTRQG